jgi:Asp/Glu/hydantoin racemase
VQQSSASVANSSTVATSCPPTIRLIDQAVQSVGLNKQRQIVTSRDPKVLQLRKMFETTNVPKR